MLKRHLPAAFLFLFLTALFTNPLLFHFWNAVEDKQDALLNTWIIAWVGHALTTDPLNLYNANIFFPYLNSLAFSEVLVPQGLLALPFSLLANNPILGYNLVLFGMLWLNAFGMYLLALDITKSRIAGILAGVTFAFNPFNLGNLAQVQLVSLGWLPLSMIYLRRLLPLDAPSRGNALAARSAFLFSVFLILQSLSSIYFALLAALVVFVYALFWLLGKSSQVPHLPAKKFSITRNSLVFPLSAFVGGLVLFGAVMLPFVKPYVTVSQELGLERTVQESEPFSASLKQFVEVSPQNLLYGHWLAPNPVRFNGGYPLDNLFPGLVAVVLATLGLLTVRSKEKWFLGALLAVAFLFSLGPRLYLSADTATGVVLPYRWLYDLVPFLKALRAPVRFEALIMLCLALLAGFGFGMLHQKISVRFLGPVIIGLAALEYLPLPAAKITVLPVASGIPPVYEWLARQPATVELELPMMGPDAENHLDISNQYFTTYHWQKTPDGYSGFNPAGRGEIAYEMEHFPGARSVSLLQALGVEYLILHRDQFLGSNDQVRNQMEQNQPLVHLQDFGQVSMYRVTPTRFDVSKLVKSIFLPRPARSASPYTAFLVLANSSGVPFAIRPTDKLDLTVSWNGDETQRVSIPMRLVTSKASVIPITLRTPAAAGTYSVTLAANDSVIGRISLSGQVGVGQESAHEVVIPAGVELQSALFGEYSRGSSLSVDLDWIPLNKIDAYYSVSVRVVDSQGNKVIAVDRQPRVPTLLWEPDVPVADHFQLTLPADLRAGTFHLQILMYADNGDTSVLLLDKNLNPEESVDLGEFQVK